MTILKRLLWLVLSVGLLTLSIFLCEWGFGKILDFRMLERIPLTPIVGAVDGEIQLNGHVIADKTTASPKTGTQAVYYRYLVEKEQRDSDGNTSWSTVRDETEGFDFRLNDGSGEALIKIRSALVTADFNVYRKHRSEQGDYRYTEWRIDPGDTLTIYGWLDTSRGLEVNFHTPGEYLPILSSFGAESERSGIGASALFLLWGGVTTIIFACFALMGALRIHKTLIFLTFVSISSFLLLLHYGFESLESDVMNGFNRVNTQIARTEEFKKNLLNGTAPLPTDYQIDFPLKLREMKITSYLVRERYLRQISRFPESFYARLKGVAKPEVIDLSPEEQAIVARRERDYSGTRVANHIILAAIGFVLSAVMAWLAFRLIRVKRMQENLPTSKTAGVTYGLAEVEGTLVKEDDAELFKGPVSGTFCTWYRHKIEERRGSGKNAKWVTLSDNIVKQPFYCEDDEGRIRVFPGNADVITKHYESERRGNRRYSEWRLSPGDELYIMGKARLDKTKGDELVFGHEKDAPYIVSNLPEAEVMFRKAIQGMALLSVGVSLLFLVVIWMSGASGQFSSLDFVLASFVAPVFLFLVVFVLMYNDLVFLKQRCERNWANIQVSLKKRATLIPRLESVVKEYLDHEEHLQRGLALLRERSKAIESGQDMDKYMAIEHASITELQARIESYPDLKGIEAIKDFHLRLVKLENEVALIRAGFNDAVTQYQTRTQTFPDNFLAKWFRFPSLNLLSFDKQAHKIPVVDLGHHR